MTGELADCFQTRREGVCEILGQMRQAVPDALIDVYSVDGKWLDLQAACNDPWRVAASNWAALAQWLCQWPMTTARMEHALIVDIGSTTVDVIPIHQCRIETDAKTDRQRLEKKQLIYTGIERTPLCAIAPSVVLHGKTIPLMAELFATSDDLYLLLELTNEEPDNHQTADGRARTRECARSRISRMIGEDTETLCLQDAMLIAQQLLQCQARTIAEAIATNLRWLAELSAQTPTIVFTGHGKELFHEAIRNIENDYHTFELSSVLNAAISRCAPAAAVAWLREKKAHIS